jgi:hypothetical protein
MFTNSSTIEKAKLSLKRLKEDLDHTKLLKRVSALNAKIIYHYNFNYEQTDF